MLDFLLELDPWFKLLLSLAAIGSVVAAILHWLRPRIRAAKDDARAIRDTLVGREALTDSITGRVISPAIPGIGSRMADQEQHAGRMESQMDLLTNAVADMADQHRRLEMVEQGQSDLRARVTAIEQGHFLERMAGKAESIQLFRTIEQVAKSDPPDDDPAA